MFWEPRWQPRKTVAQTRRSAELTSVSLLLTLFEVPRETLTIFWMALRSWDSHTSRCKRNRSKSLLGHRPDGEAPEVRAAVTGRLVLVTADRPPGRVRDHHAREIVKPRGQVRQTDAVAKRLQLHLRGLQRLPWHQRAWRRSWAAAGRMLGGVQVTRALPCTFAWSQHGKSHGCPLPRLDPCVQRRSTGLLELQHCRAVHRMACVGRYRRTRRGQAGVGLQEPPFHQQRAGQRTSQTSLS